MIQAVVGALSGVIASMGLGGGFVLLIWLTLHDGMPQREAQGVNLLFFLPIALISVIMHIRVKIWGILLRQSIGKAWLCIMK